MRNRFFKLISPLLPALLCVCTAVAGEGMWPIYSLDQLDFSDLARQGLQLSATDIYNPDGTGLWAAVVQTGGGSGAFVSADGLVITNHHVAFEAIQSQSHADLNYIEAGFLARTQAEEIPALGYNCYVCRSFEDVTDKIKKVTRKGQTDLERYQAIDKKTKEIIAAAEKGKDVKCRVASFDGGRQYMLITYFRIEDMRIVCIPPLGIGNYGGEIDNWMWPRHTGDYSFLRAYVAPDGSSAEYAPENVPFKPAAFMKVSGGPLKEGDFTMSIGYPGGTDRFENSFAIEEAVSFDYPKSIQYRRAVIGIMEEAGRQDPEVAIRVAGRIEGLANYLKNFEGMLTGLKRYKVVELRRQRESELTKAIAADPNLQKKYGNVLPELEKTFGEHSAYREKDMVLSWLGRSSEHLGLASRLYRWSIEKKKKDMERERGYMERDVPSMLRGLREAQVNLVPHVDQQLFVYALRHALSLPPGQRIEAVDRLIGDTLAAGASAAIEALAARLHTATAVGDSLKRLEMFDLSQEALVALNDPMIEFAAALYPEQEQSRERGKVFSGALKRLQPELVSAYRELGIGPKYPDANGTMRVSYGPVEGYSPADAVHYDPFTTLTGVVEKETGEEPFRCPPALLQAWKQKRFGRYLDPDLNDVPVNFLGNHDTTGGSSGSPVVNGRGALVGLCFDGNYEAIAGDYEFVSRVNRTIFVDSRYILFTLETVMDASELMNEMELVW
ncbi:MAG: S46 family peptidase [Candidatus Zixiibacteriota bacterium]